MKVADVMQKNVEYVSTDTPVEEVARIIFEKGINGIPVCEGKKLVGFITSRDILSQFFPEASEYGKTPSRTPTFEDMEKKTPQVFACLAKDIMSKNPITIGAEIPLLRAQSLMFIKKIGRLPVVDKRGNLIGLIAKADIFKALVGEKLALAENEEYNDWMAKHFSVTLDWKKRLQFEIPDIVSILDEYHCHRILDIGCGVGQHVIALAKEGYEVTGAERSKLMIQEARKKKATLPKNFQKNVAFIAGDYEHVFPHFKGRFDVAIFMGNALAHNPHNYKEVLQKTAQTLKKKAIIILQLRNMEKMLKDKKKSVSVRINPSHIEYYQQHMFVDFYNQAYNERETLTRATAVLDFDGKKWAFYGLKSTPLAYLTKEKVESNLKACGFNRIEYFGATAQWDYLFKNPFDPQNSEWLNVVAKR